MGIKFPPQVPRELNLVWGTSKPKHTGFQGDTQSWQFPPVSPEKQDRCIEGRWPGALGRGPWRRRGGWHGRKVGWTSSIYGSQVPWEVWASISPCPTWISLEDSEGPFQLQQLQIWSSFSLVTHQMYLWLDSLYWSGCWAELSIVSEIQDFAGLLNVLDLFVIYHLLLIIWANKTAMRFSFCFQHFKASTFLVKTPRPIITWTPI